ncbi:Conserved_hypothetical protein [Hexamita inflata]|uniref:Uncharacterized protein n=1 Tax=Hexamita inflata TaxID=28002 RepID=A0AA86PCZ8_9EUKA|nr:Conserved hypothetical protein [Hexamita inflata]CAI9936585.1 Conserved hypothetical protein [Hexamita inflata]CAI9950339.1 Conserved hypothetical protein [Hexamita inflata]CAI9964282.1 Conserved hypothetical protein [Hexamita inflata]
MIILHFVLHLDCFDTYTSVNYGRQDQISVFTATHALNLKTREAQACANLKGQSYQINVYIGDAIFSTTDVFNPEDKTFTLQTTCQTGNCDYNNVKQFQIASFQIVFLETDFILQGVVNSMQFRWYDKTNCFKYNQAEFSTVPANAYIDTKYDPITTCTTQPVNNNLFIDTYTNDELWSSVAATVQDVGATNNVNYISQLTNRKVMCTSSDTACINSLTQHLNPAIVKLEQALRTSVQFTKASGDSFTYNETVFVNVERVKSPYDDLCFKDVKLWINKDRMHFQTDPIIGNCPENVMSSIFTYTSMRKEIVFYDNVNGQEIKIHLITPTHQFEFDKVTSSSITCAQMDTPTECQSFLDKYYVSLNANGFTNKQYINVVYYMVNDGVDVQKFEFGAVLVQDKYLDVLISIFGTYCCLNLTTSERGIQQVTMSVSQRTEFKGVFDLLVNDDVQYCMHMDTNIMREMDNYNEAIEADILINGISAGVDKLDLQFNGTQYWEAILTMVGLVVVSVPLSYLVWKKG